MACANVTAGSIVIAGEFCFKYQQSITTGLWIVITEHILTGVRCALKKKNLPLKRAAPCGGEQTMPSPAEAALGYAGHGVGIFLSASGSCHTSALENSTRSFLPVTSTSWRPKVVSSALVLECYFSFQLFRFI